MRSIISRLVKSEEPASKHINIISHYDDVTLMDKNERFIQIVKLRGIDYITKDDQILDAYKNRFNNLLKGFSSEFAIYCYEIRRRVSQYPDGLYANDYANGLNERYKHKLKSSEIFFNELYLAVITKQPEGLINKGFAFLNQLNQRLDKKSKRQYLAKRHQELCEMTRKLMSGMADYGCELLTAYEKNGVKFSAPLELISQIINFNKTSVPFVNLDAAKLLPRKRIFFNRRSGTIELRSGDGKSKYAAILSIKAYSSVTCHGMFDELSKLKCEYLLTQSYRFYDRQVAKARVRDQQLEMQQSKDESVTQTEQLSDAFDDAASGDVGFGLHHFTLACYADSQEELNKNVGLIVSRFADLDIICVREDIASESAFWSQLPANFGYILRYAPISTRNMAGLTSFHNYSCGKRTGNHWGEAVTVFETLAGTPYYFNFHYKDVGNFLVFGAMGSGKTVLIGFLIALSMKFDGKRIIFDKDRGLEILVRAMDGVYEQIKPGIATGFNPCQLDDTAENREFLVSLFKQLLTVNDETFSEADAEIIIHAINGMFRLDKSARQFRHLASFFGAKKPGSLRSRFDQWHSDGQYAWLFDNVVDTLDLGTDVLGFDLGKILSHADCKTPALMYLVHRVEQEIAGKRGMLFIDEGWLALNDPYFRKLIDDWSRTPRKKNNIFGLATQVANDTAEISISKSINESAFCKIFFPNPSADKQVYTDSFGLNEHEYELVKSLPDDQHYFLLVHGHGANRESVVIRANLSGLEEDIAIISARENSLALLDHLRADVGDDSKNWLPLFHARLLEEKNS